MRKKYTSMALMALVLAGAVLLGSSSAQAQASNATNAPSSDVVKDWHGSLSLGISLAKGNTDTLLAHLAGRVDKDWKQDECSFGAGYTYGFNDWRQSNQSKFASSLNGFADYKRLFTDRFYGSLHIEGDHDDLAALRYRLIVGPNAGYYFIKSDASRLNLEVGPSYIRESLGDNPPIPPGHNETDSYITLRIAERGEHQLSKTSKIWEQVEYLPQVDKLSNYLLNSEAGAEASLNAHLALRVVVDDKYNNKPAVGKKTNDIQLVASVVWKFGPE